MRKIKNKDFLVKLFLGIFVINTLCIINFTSPTSAVDGELNVTANPDAIFTEENIVIQWTVLAKPYDGEWSYGGYISEIWMKKYNGDFIKYTTVSHYNSGTLSKTIPLSESGVYLFEVREYCTERHKWVGDRWSGHSVSESGLWHVATEQSNSVSVYNPIQKILLEIPAMNVETGIISEPDTNDGYYISITPDEEISFNEFWCIYDGIKKDIPENQLFPIYDGGEHNLQIIGKISNGRLYCSNIVEYSCEPDGWYFKTLNDSINKAFPIRDDSSLRFTIQTEKKFSNILPQIKYSISQTINSPIVITINVRVDGELIFTTDIYLIDNVNVWEHTLEVEKLKLRYQNQNQHHIEIQIVDWDDSNDNNRFILNYLEIGRLDFDRYRKCALLVAGSDELGVDGLYDHIFKEDAIDFYNVLNEFYFYSDDEIFLLIKTFSDIKKDNETTMQNLKWTIRQISKNSQEHEYDEIIIWWSSHGNVDILECGENSNNLLTSTYFNELLSMINYNNMYVFVQACNSGSFIIDNNNTLEYDSICDPNRIVFTSSGDDESSYPTEAPWNDYISDGLTYQQMEPPQFPDKMGFPADHYTDFYNCIIYGNQNDIVSMYELWYLTYGMMEQDHYNTPMKDLGSHENDWHILSINNGLTLI